VLTRIMLLVFRVNGHLLTAGDRLVADLGLTSARWQMLGAIAMEQPPRTAPRLATRMGVTRQAAQKQLDLLLDEGLVATHPNPGHLRSPAYVLTRRGAAAYESALRLEKGWSSRLARDMPLQDLETTEQLLTALERKLRSPDQEVP
jgi:DNA-binding MarR family transcriptional regulator